MNQRPETAKQPRNPLLFGCAAAGIFIVIGAVLRFSGLGRQSLWNDEIFSLDVALRPFVEIPSWLAQHYHHPPLFFFLAHTAIQIFGPTEWALRFSSALFGTATVGCVTWAAWRSFGRTGAVLAGLLILTAPFHIAYSQEGRPYALAGFLTVVSCYSFHRWIHGRKKQAFPYILSTLALLYTHHWGMFVLFAQVVITIARLVRGTIPFRHLFIAWLVIGAAYIPEFIVLRHQDAATPAEAWFWVQRPETGTIVHMLTAYSGTFFAMATSVFSLASALQFAGAAAILVLLIIGITGMKQPDLRYYLLLSILVPGVPFCISFVKPEVFLWYRYTVIPYPLWLITIGGIAAMRPGSPGMAAHPAGKPVAAAARFIPVILALTLVIIGITGCLEYFRWEKSNVRDAVTYAETMTARYHAPVLIRPKNFNLHFRYYYHGAARVEDEAWLDTPLGGIVDTTSTFGYLSLDIPNDIRTYFDTHFDRIVQKSFPGEAHMGLIVGIYRQRHPVDQPD